MEFTITASEVLQAENSINALSKVKMKGTYGISVARLHKAITKKAEEIRKDRLELVKKNSDKQEDGKYKVKEGHELDLEKDGKSLLESEVIVRANPIPRGVSEIEVEPAIWYALIPFLQEEVDRKKKEKQECSDG